MKDIPNWSDNLEVKKSNIPSYDYIMRNISTEGIEVLLDNDNIALLLLFPIA